MVRLLLILGNTLAPGVALVARGHLVMGLALLLPALAGVSVWMVVIGPGGQSAAWLAGMAGLLVYLLCALLASVAWWRIVGGTPPDPTQVRALHREVAVHYLRSDWSVALPAAQRLSRLAVHEPGAWRVLELVALGAGDVRMARAAAAKARSLDEDAQV